MSDTGELLEAMDFALESIADAIDNLKGYPELKSHLDALHDVEYELLKEHDVLDAAMNVEYQQQIAETMRDYYSDKL